VLQVAHHGSRSSSTPEFLAAVRPVVTLAATGTRPRFAYPDPSVALRARGLPAVMVGQGLGAASVLLATLLLGATLGPEVQGGFSRTKSEIEFIGAFAMFGLPQALFFHVKAGRLGGRVALRWALGSAVLALPIGALVALVQHAHAGASAIAVLGIAVSAFVAHGQLRALLLARERTEWFNLLTALPQVLLLAGVGSVLGWRAVSAPDASAWPVLFALAYGTAAMLAWRRLRAATGAPVAAQVGWRELGHYGLAAWLAAALSAAAILGAQLWVEAGEGRTALGQFTMAMTLVQVPLTPISYAAPLLFRRWMERPGARVSRRWARALFALLLGVASLVWLAAAAWPDLGLGSAYAGATRALAVLLAGGAAEAASRVLTVQASASGLPWIAVQAEAARWAVMAIGCLAPLPKGMLPLCAVWAVAAWAAALVFVLHARIGKASMAGAR